MEAPIEGDLAGPRPAHARDILDALGDFVPGAVVFVGGGVSRRGNGLVAEDEGIESDDFAVRMEDVDGELAGDEARDGRDDGEGFLLAQHVELFLRCRVFGLARSLEGFDEGELQTAIATSKRRCSIKDQRGQQLGNGENGFHAISKHAGMTAMAWCCGR